MDTSQPSTRTWWLHSFYVAFGAALFYTVYVIIQDGYFDLVSFAKVMAGTANFLFAASFSLSGLGYYFNVLDSKVIYRKYLGLLGFFAALIYTLLLPVVRPDYYFYGFFDHLWSSDVLLGTTSIAIFTVMALISNNGAMQKIGPLRWRTILRLGYVAFFLLVVRAVLNNENPIGADARPEMWLQYFANPDGLPPVRLVFSVIAMAVIFFRLSIEFDKWRGRNHPKPSLS
jgi:DMSO/TMAO reductase YedYZ heme-binding membrane subunit